MDVLVVDDDDDLREALVETLQDAGLDSLGVGDASTLVATVARLRPNVVLLDLTMPGLVVDDLMAEIRRHLGPGAPPVIALSGRDDVAAIALRTGLAEALRKPLDASQVVDVVRRHARLSGDDTLAPLG